MLHRHDVPHASVVKTYRHISPQFTQASDLRTLIPIIDRNLKPHEVAFWKFLTLHKHTRCRRGSLAACLAQHLRDTRNAFPSALPGQKITLSSST